MCILKFLKGAFTLVTYLSVGSTSFAVSVRMQSSPKLNGYWLAIVCSPEDRLTEIDQSLCSALSLRENQRSPPVTHGQPLNGSDLLSSGDHLKVNQLISNRYHNLKSKVRLLIAVCLWPKQFESKLNIYMKVLEPMPFPNATGSERGKQRLMFSLGVANCAE